MITLTGLLLIVVPALVCLYIFGSAVHPGPDFGSTAISTRTAVVPHGWRGSVSWTDPLALSRSEPGKLLTDPDSTQATRDSVAVVFQAFHRYAGVFEETGFKAAGTINAISYILWSVWLIALGIALLLH